MLTEVKAYSSWQAAPTLLLDNTGRPETDLIQIRNIEGLNPVNASVNTSPRGAVDGTTYLGSSIESRNIVLTLHPNPDWNTWTYEALRRLLYSYFMPKKSVGLAFYSDDIVPVKISGIVESTEVALFSKDPEIVVSVICPDPYFTALEETIITGTAIRSDGEVTSIEYNGTIETGIQLKVSAVSTPNPTTIGVQIGDPDLSYFDINATVDESMYFEMSSVPLQKYAHNVDIDTAVIANLLYEIIDGSSWPVLQPGSNDFSVITDQGDQDWQLIYFERFGGL